MGVFFPRRLREVRVSACMFELSAHFTGGVE